MLVRSGHSHRRAASLAISYGVLVPKAFKLQLFVNDLLVLVLSFLPEPKYFHWALFSLEFAISEVVTLSVVTLANVESVNSDNLL